MKTVTVAASKKYDVIIGNDLLPQIGHFLSPIQKSSQVAIISDHQVWAIYGQSVSDALKCSGYHPTSFVFPSGETSKSGKTYLEILNFLAENKITRSDMIIALGGGVVGDMAGFCAATYLRGISYVQIPTTLLAMVDSSVGGKTAIDLPAGKNLAGAFYQPSLVLCDLNVLQTLPAEIFRDGCAEVIKYGILYDPSLFDHLTAHGLDFDREYVITRCVELKRNVVCEDEFDTGARQKLNLGHTVGHGIEAHSDFTVSHGQAVAIGMAIVAKASASWGICSQDIPSKIIQVLDQFGLPYQTHYSALQLQTSALSDKKRFGGTINLILPVAIGNCIIQSIPIEKTESFIKAGL